VKDPRPRLPVTAPATRGALERRPAPADPLGGRPVLRVLIGLGRLTIDSIQQLVAAPSATTPPPTGARRPAKHQVLVGAIVSLPSWTRAARRTAPARLARRAAAALAATRPGGAIAGLLVAARSRARLVFRRLAAIGEEEERRDEALARTAVEEAFEVTCARLAESEAIRRLVREQTTSLTATAIYTLRAWAAAADDAIDRAFERAVAPFRRHRHRRRRFLLPAGSPT